MQVAGQEQLSSLGPLAYVVVLPIWIPLASPPAMPATGIDVKLRGWRPLALHCLEERNHSVHIHARIVSSHGYESGRNSACSADGLRSDPRIEQQQEVRQEAQVVDVVDARVGAGRRSGDPRGQQPAGTCAHEPNLGRAEVQRLRARSRQAERPVAVHQRDVPTFGPRQSRHAVLQDECRDAERVEPLRQVRTCDVEGQMVVTPSGRYHHGGVHAARVPELYQVWDQGRLRYVVVVIAGRPAIRGAHHADDVEGVCPVVGLGAHCRSLRARHPTGGVQRPRVFAVGAARQGVGGAANLVLEPNRQPPGNGAGPQENEAHNCRHDMEVLL
mmetsp:Transcript_12562/g.35815  ORF Transcript_12562/g.35815 Transcript_12562/m.35815 type:complete len:329 (-) Transcript_12562:48-1034(-)